MLEQEPLREIVFEPTAERDYRKLPQDVLEDADEKILKLAANPFPPGCIHLSGYELYRIWLRRGWRITYAVEPGRIVVVEVAPRQRAYKRLKR